MTLARSFPLALTLGVGCALWAGGPLARGQARSGPVAVVDGTPVDAPELGAALARLNARAGRRGKKPNARQVEAVTRTIVRDALRDELVARALKKEGIRITDKDVTEALADHRSQFNHAKGFTAHEQALGRDEGALKAELKKRLAIDALASKYFKDKRPTRAAAKKELETNRDAYQIPAQTRLSQIFLRYPQGANFAAKDEIRRRAQGIMRQLEKDKQQFPALAKRYSDGPSAAQGGALGMVRKGRLSSDIDVALEGKKVGDLVGPVDTAFGVHIFIVEELRGPHQGKVGDWEQVVYQTMQNRYEERAHQKVLKKLYEEAQIEIKAPGVTFTPEEFASMNRVETRRR